MRYFPAGQAEHTVADDPEYWPTPQNKQAVDPDIAERAAVLANLKKQIALAKVNAQRAATIEAQKKIDDVKKWWLIN